MASSEESWFAGMIDLASEAVGGWVVSCTDDFFAPVSNLLKTEEPVWREGEYTESGKWMDGWESRRKREPGHDWCELALGIPGRVSQVTIDTSFFTGNYPESFSLEGCGVEATEGLAHAEWVELIAMTPLEGDSVARFRVDDRHRMTHLRLHIYPDGGVARLRVEGMPIPSIEHVCPSGSLVDLASSYLGAEATDASDMHYSSPSNLLRPGRPRGMWDGWETRRRRGPGHDWVVVRLGAAGVVHALVVDTTHFKGNAPAWISVDVSRDGLSWEPVIQQHDVSPDEEGTIELPDPMPASHLRLNVHPDGGLARVRVLGRPDVDAAARWRIEYVNALLEQQAEGFFAAACAATRWVGHMVGARPFENPQAVMNEASAAFDSLEPWDWLEAFAAHPRIGESGDAVASREQAGVSSASRSLLSALKKVNREYESKFGFTYIVFASGKTASEMLAIAQGRLDSDKDVEIATAAGEQRLITRTRLARMLCLEPKS